MISVSVTITEEQIEEAFENAEIRFSKKKLKELLKEFDTTNPDILVQLEERLQETVEEFITDYFE